VVSQKIVKIKQINLEKKQDQILFFGKKQIIINITEKVTPIQTNGA